MFHALFPSFAAADERVRDTALAHDLFDQGRELLERHDYANACRKFEESRKLTTGTAGGIVLNLALCRELSGQTGTAWALFREAHSVAVRDHRDDRREFAERHIADLMPRLSRLRIVVPADARTPGLSIRRNGIAIAETEWGEALVVDPGELTVEVSAPGKQSRTISTKIEGEGRTAELSIPALAEKPTAAPRASSASFIQGPQRVAGVITTTAGLATIAMGSLLSVRATRKHDSANVLCPDYEHCDPNGIALSEDAASDARISTALIIGGAIVAAGGVIVFLTAPARVRHNRAAATPRGTVSFGVLTF
jgi:hypothetical protein